VDPRIEVPVAVPEELAEELEKKLGYVAEGVISASYDPVLKQVSIELVSRDAKKVEQVRATVREIAATLTSSYRPGLRKRVGFRKASHPGKADPHPALSREGELKEFGRGRLGVGPKVMALIHAIDALILDKFSQFAPVEYQFPSLISAEVLDRCRYLKNFPASLSLVAHLREDLSVLQKFAGSVRWEMDHLVFPREALSPFGLLLAPSVCFHWYAWLQGENLANERTITAVGKCFRYESNSLLGLERLWDFTMREVVFVGVPMDVRTRRDAALRAGESVLEALDLSYELVTATDPFFLDSYSVQAAFQQGFELKHEFLCPLAYRGKNLAVGSVNYHQDFFGRSFNITVGDAPCHTGCIGFGLERLALAVLAQHGTETKHWPAALQEALRGWSKADQ
jgi:seryl-tRNA synthetase